MSDEQDYSKLEAGQWWEYEALDGVFLRREIIRIEPDKTIIYLLKEGNEIIAETDMDRGEFIHTLESHHARLISPPVQADNSDDAIRTLETALGLICINSHHQTGCDSPCFCSCGFCGPGKEERPHIRRLLDDALATNERIKQLPSGNLLAGQYAKGWGEGYDETQRQAQETIEALQAEVQRLTGESSHWQNELAKVAGLIEPHWRGAGARLEAEWMINQIAAWGREDDDEIEQLEAEIETTRTALAAAQAALKSARMEAMEEVAKICEATVTFSEEHADHVPDGDAPCGWCAGLEKAVAAIRAVQAAEGEGNGQG